MQTAKKYSYSFNRVYEPLPVSACFKTQPDDFIVEEQIPFSLSGEGEHCWLYLEKRLLNTDEVAQKLARFAGVKPLAVGYAGLKDKYAVTSQWFSVQMPGRETPDWRQLACSQIRVLDSTRHSRKLQRGALSHNTFRIRLREVRSPEQADAFDLLAARCEAIAAGGVPNYFGRQRFGRGLNNLDAAAAMFQPACENETSGRRKKQRLSRHQRSLYLSSARSWLFNHLLSMRIEQGNWNRRLPGDVFMLNGKTACFSDDGDAALEQRLAQFEIHPTGVLWGEGDSLVRGEAAALEENVVNRFPVFRDGLVAARVKAQRRALRLRPAAMHFEQQAGDLMVRFQLPAGAYATVVLDELLAMRTDLE